MTRKSLIVAIAVATAGCTAQLAKHDATRDAINAEMDKAVEERAKQAMMPPLVVEMPKAVEAKPLEQRFDLNVSGAPAAQVFMAIASGTRYSMVVHPDIRESISVNLKDVTVLEALNILRDLYGYEYRVESDRITVLPITMRTRVFRVNYIQANRIGRSDMRVSSGSISDAPTSGGVAGGGTSVGGQPQRLTESSRVTTSSDSNFWGDITKSITAIVGSGGGRNVIVNAQSGVIVVRALPAELRSVESFLKEMQLIVDRQVMLEAKIIDVSLREGFEAGINWAAFRDGSTRAATGVVRPGSTIGNTGDLSTPTALLPDGSIDSASAFTATLGSAASLATGLTAPGAVFGLALQTSNFAALLTFLETQGSVNVLSSPRVATINNQKAVLKVGQDDFFVTNISTTSTTSGSGVVTTPTITVQPFFSGVALDVTPQIDDQNNIILHVHPQVSRVVEQRKVIDLGTGGVFVLPLASSSVNETDTIVRVQDGNIVAIGGLMRQESASADSQVPGAGDVPGLGALFQQKNRRTTKSEIVILMKPTIVHSDRTWQQDLIDTRDRLRAMQPTPTAPQQAAPATSQQSAPAASEQPAPVAPEPAVAAPQPTESATPQPAVPAPQPTP
jgi:MSHA biogenesis protein MshL